VAPVIDADPDDVAASIAFTAVLGVVAVVMLPLLAHLFGLSATGGGALAGLTVYAVPQVIAAAAPLGAKAVQLGTLVKLVRVLMLGPVVATLSFLAPKRAEATHKRAALLPWFIIAFLAMMALRSTGLLPERASEAAGHVSTMLTIVSMAALGLGVDLRSVAAAGPRVTAVVTLSLTLLIAIALLVIRLAGLR
jgi:uncharacterized integral membrane protein (TIGR00698 family)